MRYLTTFVLAKAAEEEKYSVVCTCEHVSIHHHYLLTCSLLLIESLALLV